jgi:hypothetical protein
MPGLWKVWEAKGRLPTLSTSPLEISPTAGEISTFPQLRPRRRMEKWKTKSRFPTFPPPRFHCLKNKKTTRAGFALARGSATAQPQWSPFPPPRWFPVIPPLTPSKALENSARTALDSCTGRTLTDVEWERARTKLLEFAAILCSWVPNTRNTRPGLGNVEALCQREP